MCARSMAGNNEGQQPTGRIRLAGTWNKVMVLNLRGVSPQLMNTLNREDNDDHW